MTFIPVVMLLSMSVVWYGFCRRKRNAGDLHARLAGVRAEVLAGCVIVFTAMMPALRFALILHLADVCWVLPSLLALEAAVCLGMLLVRHKLQDRALDEWHSHVWENLLRREEV